MNRLTYSRLDELLVRARNVHVLVVGDLMLDVYLRGSASRISPEAPVPVVKVQEEWRALGGAANVAANAVALGTQCTVIGCVGADAAGRELRQELDETGILTDGLVESARRPTTIKTRIMARQYQVARYDMEVEHDIDEELAEALIQRLTRLVSRASAIVLEDYNKGVLVPALSSVAIRLAREIGIPVVVDPKFRSFYSYRGATVFKPNLTELSAALRDEVRPDDAAWLERIRTELGCENLLLTLGEDGMALSTAAGEYIRVPTEARSVYDVSGAGDTVSAAVAVALAAGASINEAALLATQAAALVVGKAGVATVSPAELRDALRERQEKALSIQARRSE
jgi:D-beta-D-heptose 7-phosphate kinase/D-beta-D-heptose 1-phosphate adenosyltransferase